MKNSTEQAEIQTAFTLADVLNQGENQRVALKNTDYWPARPMDGPFADPNGMEFWREGQRPEVDAMLERVDFVERLAESRITGISLLPHDRRAVDEALGEKVFYVAVSPQNRDAALLFKTGAALDGKLAVRVADERAASERGPGGSHNLQTHRAIPAPLYAEMVDEAIAWHATHPDDEVRCCAYCETRFVARYRKRARFCSDECRKGFLLLVNGPPAGVPLPNRRILRCVLGNHDVSVQTYSGLIRDDLGRLKMAGYWEGELDARRTCAACVEEQYPSWRAYVLPVLKIQERVAS